MPLAIIEGEGIAPVQEHGTNRNTSQKNSAITKSKSALDLSQKNLTRMISHNMMNNNEGDSPFIYVINA